MSAATTIRRRGVSLAVAVGLASAVLIGQEAVAPTAAQAHMSCTAQVHRHWYSVYTWSPVRAGSRIDWFTSRDGGTWKYEGTVICT
jgi:hypothetical protein